jgi:hypothetical protein
VIQDGKPTIALSAAQLAMLLEGIEPIPVKRRKRFFKNSS